MGIIEQGCSVMEYLACISSFLRQYCCWFWRCVFCLVPSQLCSGTEKVPEVYKATAAGEPVSETADLLSPQVFVTLLCGCCAVFEIGIQLLMLNYTVWRLHKFPICTEHLNYGNLCPRCPIQYVISDVHSGSESGCWTCN